MVNGSRAIRFYNNSWHSRMLKQSASFVLGSSKSSTYPRGYASGFDSPAALLDELFEHPGGMSYCGCTCTDSQRSRLPTWTFFNLLDLRGCRLDGSSTRLSVAAGAEWVRAPIEIRSGPAAAIARTFCNVTPPDTSTTAFPLINRIAWRTVAGLMLSSKMMSACPSTACRTSSKDSTSTMTLIPRGALVLALRQAVRMGMGVCVRSAR
jgi:hypothetical protein